MLATSGNAKAENNGREETQSSTVSDCFRSIDDICVHVIRFDELETSFSNENGVRV